MNQQEMDYLLNHLVDKFADIDGGYFDEDLALGTLEALAGDFVILHEAIVNGSPLPTAWSK